MATITGKPRHKVDVLVWNWHCWTQNIFRVWEMIFWRACEYGEDGGLKTQRLELSWEPVQIGKKEVWRVTPHTFEAKIGQIEGQARQQLDILIAKFIYLPRAIEILALAMSSGQPLAIPLALGVVAYDNSNINATNGTTVTVTFTLTGSNLYIVGIPFINSNTDGMTNVKWNTSETLTKLQTAHAPFSQYIYIFGLINPTSGSHNLVGTSSVNHRLIGQSYSGVNSLDTSNTGTNDNTQTLSMTITAGVANCVLVGGACNNFGDANSSTDGNVRQHNGAGWSGVDKTLTSSGSNSVDLTGVGASSTTDWAWNTLTLAPPAVPPVARAMPLLDLFAIRRSNNF